MSITNLGKRKYKILRQPTTSISGYVDGEWVKPVVEELTIMANIQPSTFSYRTQLLKSGDRDKEAVNIYSNDWLYQARSGANPIECDVLLYRGAEWEVVVSKPYGNSGRHCEALAIKRDDSLVSRPDGYMEKIN
jgi:hypothetical protein